MRLDRDAPATYEYFWSHGMISDEIGLAIMNDCNFDDYSYESPHNVSNSCNNAIYEANLIVGNYINNYDVILDVCYPSIAEQELRLKKMVGLFQFCSGQMLLVLLLFYELVCYNTHMTERRQRK